MKRSVCNALYVWLLLAALFGLAGCATTDTENLSERPWNAPKGWETGLPSTINEGR
jgi:hypothetical protein